ncbi:hypothetical protein FB451DRAFT_1513582 [Mycena latifolia]|nr:hypothetical protein FB451DRAFT_1513582 [Mycena latifolia]
MSATVANLRARIEELSSAITHRIQILRAVEKDKSDVQRTQMCHRANGLPQCIYSWSNIALSTPSLWTAIRIQSPRPETFDELFLTWMQRVHGFPVSLSLMSFLTDGVQLSVKEHAHRVQNIELRITSDYELRYIITAAFSSLATLKLEGISVHEFLDCPEWWLEILRAAPVLVERNFINICCHYTYACAQQRVDYAVSYSARPPNPSLLGLRYHARGRSLLPETVLTFTENGHKSSAPDHGFLPNLHNLTIYEEPNNCFLYDFLIALLTAPRALQSFSSIFSYPYSSLTPRLDDDTIMALRQLVEDGMIIHVGPEDKNLIYVQLSSLIIPVICKRESVTSVTVLLLVLAVMASAPDLRARIEELSSAIENPKQVLGDLAKYRGDALDPINEGSEVGRLLRVLRVRDLEKRKSDAQRDLNAILDPMARLPLDICSDILTQCLPRYPSPLDAQEAPLRNLALSTPSLWNTICLWEPHIRQFDKLLEVCLERARSLPLSLWWLSSDKGSDESLKERIQALLEQHTHRHHDLPASRNWPFRTPGLPPSPVSTNVWEMLRGAPNLEDCTFEGLHYEESVNETPSLTHSSLRHLHLGLPRRELDQVEPPHHRFQHPPRYFSVLLGRSSRALLSLDMNMPNEERASRMVDTYFRLIPGLRSLALECSASQSQFFLHFLDTLATDQDLLPNLRNLTIWGDFRYHRSQCEEFISLLQDRGAARHARLQSFRLILTLFNEDDPNDASVAEIAGALQLPSEDRIRTQSGWRIEAAII